MIASWQELYRAALFENDRRRFPERIAKAEKALIRRARELFETPGNSIDEEQAIDDALRALHCLRDSVVGKKAA
jgi:hypothetical protein